MTVRIYQGKNGAIYLTDKGTTQLTFDQVGELGIDLRKLDDFNFTQFKNYYVEK